VVWLFGFLFAVVVAAWIAQYRWTHQFFYEREKQWQFTYKTLMNYIVAKNVGDVKVLEASASSDIPFNPLQFAAAQEEAMMGG